MAAEEESQRSWPDLTPIARDLLSGREDAEDVAQDLWVMLQRHSREQIRSVRPWLVVAIKRIAVRRRQRDRRRAERERIVAKPGLAPSVSDVLELESLRASLNALVEELAEPYREVVRLRYFEEREIHDIAARLRRSPGTVRSQIKRGLDLLRIRLGAPPSHRGRIQLLVPWLWGRWRRASAQRTLAGGIAVGVLVVTIFFATTGVDRPQRVAASPEPRLVPGEELSELTRNGERWPIAVPERAPLEAPMAGDEAWNTAVEVTVVDPDRQPVAGANIRIANPDGSAARVVGRSDGSGHCRIGEVDRRLCIWAEEETRIPSSRHFVGSIPSGCDLELMLGHEIGSLTGRVLSADRVPVAEARVTLLGGLDRLDITDQTTLANSSLQRSTVTDTDGRFVLGQSNGRFQRLMVQAEGHSPSVTVVLRAEAPQEVELFLAPPTSLGGTLLRPDGTPVAAARLALTPADPFVLMEVETDERGRFLFESVPSGSYVLQMLSDPSAALQSCYIEGVLAAGERAWTDVMLTEGGAIHGRVLDGEQPLAGWHVELWDASLTRLPPDHRKVSTDDSGRFVFPSCTPGASYVLRLFEPGAGTDVPLAVLHDVRAGMAPLLVHPAEKRLHPGSVEGSFECVSFARMPVLACLRGDGFFAPRLLLVDPVSGRFSASHVPAGEHDLCAWIPGVGPWTVGAVEVRSDERTELHVQVPEPGTLVVRVGALSDPSVVVALPCFQGPQGRSVQRLRPGVEPGVFVTQLMPGEYDYWTDYGRSIQNQDKVRIESGTVTERGFERSDVSVTLRLSLERPLRSGETLTGTALTPGGPREIRFSPERVDREEVLPLVVPSDATELVVSSDNGLSGKLVLAPDDVVAGAELQMNLVANEVEAARHP